ncbi:unnamed protein product [Ceutorhynchus assimilis]|uniref:Uncharacterized protein n=1 Tax=Ceutorhynchus assimilis TaxID=467358 RepID=A0A9N9QRB9_9CUCU|nr:unnamed protein product [Ceutorhynchus assimilis]
MLADQGHYLKVISPILLGIGVYVHREFGSRHIVDFLNNWGFLVTYNETYQYENRMIKDNVETVASENSLVQYYITQILLLKLLLAMPHFTICSMGGIRLSTPSPPATPKSIARQIDIVSSTAAAEKDNISISWYKASKTFPLKNVIVRDIKIGVDKPPSWGGTMKLALNGYMECEKTSVTILPFINMSPTDPSTIYSALKYALKETQQLGQEHCIVTFDQQLYDKAVKIIVSEPQTFRNILCFSHDYGFHEGDWFPDGFMLPYFHAAGSYHYAKLAHLYVQQCDDLENVMPKNKYKKFVKQYFTICRSEGFWTGVLTDQVIGQELMRNFKGQTHKRGTTENTLSHFVYSFPGCLPLCNVMEESCGQAYEKRYQTNDQDVDLTESHRIKDSEDLHTFIEWFRNHSPYEKYVTNYTQYLLE